MNNNSNSIQIVLAEPTTITFGSHSIRCIPCATAELPRLIALTAPIFADLFDVQQALAAGKFEVVALFIGANAERCIDLCELASGLPRAQIDQLPADELVELFAGLLKLNADFFTRRVMPALKKAVPEGLVAKLMTTPSDGPSPSSSSSNTGTV
jgi:hypothetical protein